MSLVALAFACSSKSDDAAAGAPSAPDGGDPPGSTPPTDGTKLPDGGAIPGITPTVTGVLKTTKGAAPVGGVEVRVLDATNTARFAITDSQGAFSFSQVANPYDLHVAIGDRGQDYLGVTAAKLDLRTALIPAPGAGAYQRDRGAAPGQPRGPGRGVGRQGRAGAVAEASIPGGATYT